MKKYSAMAMYDGILPEHRAVYLAEEVKAELDELVSLLSFVKPYVVDPDAKKFVESAIAKHKGD